MECLSSIKIHDYIDVAINPMESAMVRDHLITCPSCRKQYEIYDRLEKSLLQATTVEPPEIIERNVLRAIFPRIPAYSSIVAFIAASFLLTVTWIYVYFDFANNSLIQAIRLTSDNTSNWLGSVVKVISAIFSAVYTVFKVLNTLIEILFKVDIGTEIIGLFTVALFTLIFYFVSQGIFKKIGRSNG